MAASLIVASTILFTVVGEWVEAEWMRLLLVSVTSTATVIIVTLLTPKTDEKILDDFYQRVNPPGFWRKTAARLGLDQELPTRTLKEGAYLVIATASTIYLLLVGIGKLMLPAPDTSILPALIYIVLGIASVALWWKKVKA
jgi:hypothetical protein